MPRTRLLTILVLLAFSRVCLADVVVLANRTGQAIAVRVVDGRVRRAAVEVPAWEVVPLATDGPCEVEVASGRGAERYSLQANSAYYFGSLPGGPVRLHQIGLGGDAETEQGRDLPGAGSELATLRVKILVDDEEPELERRWQDRLRRRIEAASAVLERHCRVRLAIVSFDTWNSNNSTRDFHESMAEFEREVDPRPATLAIGFSSQYHVPQGQTHMGGTRGPLHSHVLLREWSRHVTERVRLEILVHELGHYVGAAHSPEATSVMRSVLGGANSQTGLRIGFDPVNTLAMYLVAEELRHRNVRNFADLTPATKKRLRQIYTELGRANPKDQSAKRFVQLVEHREAVDPLEEPTRIVLDAIVSAAEEVNRLRASGVNDLRGDELTERYVRRAASAAARLDPKVAPTAFVLALGMAIDDTQALRLFPKTAAFVKAVEPEDAVQARLKVLGEPTLGKRADLAKHFFVSAYLAAALGAQAAETTGEAKELLDATGESGYSFVDMAANRAGIVFARRILDRSVPLRRIADDSTIQDFMPDIAGLEEGLALADFRAKYGGKSDQRYLDTIREIDRRIEELPAYRNQERVPAKEPPP